MTARRAAADRPQRAATPTPITRWDVLAAAAVCALAGPAGWVAAGLTAAAWGVRAETPTGLQEAHDAR